LKKKIRFFHLLNNYTGSPQVLRSVIEICVQEGYEVILYTSDTKGFLSGISGITYQPNFYRRSEHRAITLFTFFLSQLLLGCILLRTWSEKSIFYINTILPFSAIFAGKLMGKRVISHVHEYELSPKILSDFLFWATRTFSSDLVVVSKFLAQNSSLGGRTVHLIPNAVNKAIADKGHSVAWSDDQFQVLMLASLRPYKGIGDFVKLANRMVNIQFVLVLSDLEEDVDSWTESLDFGDNLKIYPVQDDVVQFYQSSHLVLNLAHPEEWLETFGLTILEGFQFGLPAIVPTRGGVIDLVDHGINGYLIDYFDQDKLIRAIVDLSSSRDVWHQMSIEAKKKAALFSNDVFRTRILKLLNQ
jgi:glycosyltransferase involved in cell wall biosynthesis